MGEYAVMLAVLYRAALVDFEQRIVEPLTLVLLALNHCLWTAAPVFAGFIGFGDLPSGESLQMGSLRESLPGVATQMGMGVLEAAAIFAGLTIFLCLMEKATGRAGFGGGDVKLTAVLAFCLSWQEALGILGAACILACLAALVLRWGRRTAFPFVPYMALAAGLGTAAFP